MTKSNTRQTADIAHVVGRKNLIINGGFDVSQRGDYTTATAINDATYYLDRWRSSCNLGAGNFTLQNTSANLPSTNLSGKAAKVTASTSGTAYMGLRQRYEHMSNLVGKTVTLSAMVKSNSLNARLTSFTGTLFTSTTHTGDGTWQKLSLTFTVNSSSYNFFDVFICSESLGNTSITTGDYIEVTDVQLELGSVATDFEHRSYGEELALCQRYCVVYEYSADNKPIINVNAESSVNSYGILHLPDTLRAVPTIVWAGTVSDYKLNFSSGLSVTSGPSTVVLDKHAAIILVVGSGLPTNGAGQLRAKTSNAKVTIDAEL